MVSFPALSRPHEQVLEMGGQRYFLATTEQAREMGLKRSWDVDWIAEQGVDRSKPFVLDIDTFHGGYGYSHASIPGVYDRADGFDMAAPGKARTWPVLSSFESFNTVSDYRGWVQEHGGYVYVARGRYVAKYQLSDTPGSAPQILEMHNLGSGMACAGQPAEHGGYLYVPIVQISDEVTQRFHRLTTVSADIVEVQTIAMSGTPTSGTYTISYNDGVATYTTAAIAFDAASTVVQAALRLLPGLQKITIVQSGSIPNFTHTITMTAAPGALASTSPPQFTSTDGTSGGTHTITHGTSVAGTVDQWDLGPASHQSRAFVAWFDKLTLATANTVSSATADPMTAGSWSALYPVGDAGRNVTALAVLGDDLLAAKPDGLWSFDETAHARPEITDLVHVIDAQNGIGMAAAQGALFMPHRSGLVRWRPGAFAVVGAEQEGYLEGDTAVGWGRVMGVAPFGKVIYYTINDTLNGQGALVSVRPGGRAVGFVPHMSHLFAGPVEHCAILSLNAPPPAPSSITAPTDDSAVGTIAWTNLGNAQYSDDTYATAAVGTSHYLKALMPAATRVPAGATVLGVTVGVERKMSVIAANTGAISPGTGGNLASVGTNAWTDPTNITATDNSYATNATVGVTQGLRGSNLGLTVPTTATILGVKVEIERKQSAAGASTATAATLSGTGSSAGSSSTKEVWANPSRITADDASYATAQRAIYNETEPLYGTNYGLSVPTDATILGITLEIEKLCNTNQASDWTVALTKDGSAATGDNKAAGGTWPTSPTVSTYGGAADLWGTTWTPAEVNASTFGGMLAAAFTSGTPICSVDFFRITVTYQTADGVDSTVKLVGAAGTVVGDNKASASAWPTSDAYATYGGAADLWGATLTPAIVNDTDFGAALSATIPADGRTLSADHMRITVYYEDADVKDAVVKLVRAGSVVGDNKAATTTMWPTTEATASYGGSGDLWGTTLTVAQANANDIGVVLSVTNTTGIASVDTITIVIYYQPAGAGDPGSYICVLEVDAAKTTVTPRVVKLGRAGLDPANDPNISHAASNVSLWTPRYYAPDRSVSKVYRALTCWLDLDPQTNTPGVQVWATVDDGTEFQMLDGAGAAAEFTTSGAKRLFFPKTSAAVGHWVQFRVTVPALAGAEVGLDATIRNVKVYGVYNPVMTQQITMALILRQGQHADGQRELRTPDDQASDLADLAKPQAAATTYKDPETGEEGYFDVQGPHITEMRFKSGQQTLRTAIVKALVQSYT